MKRNTFTNFMRLGVIALIVLPASALAQQEQRSELVLTLDTHKSSYVLGEPVYVTVHLKNESAKSAQVRTSLRPSAGFLTVQVRAAEERAAREFIPLAIGDFELPVTTLGPGQSMNDTFPIFFGGYGWTFPDTGSYEISARHAAPGMARQLSPPVTITVTRGRGAGTYLFSRPKEDQIETGKFLIWQQGDHLRRAQATLDEIVTQYPDSPVSDYARLATGISLSRPFHDYSIGRVRPAQPDLALELLNAVPDKTLPDLLKLKRQLALARSFEGVAQTSDAQTALAEARELANNPERGLGETLSSALEFDPALRTLANQAAQ